MKNKEIEFNRGVITKYLCSVAVQQYATAASLIYYCFYAILNLKVGGLMKKLLLIPITIFPYTVCLCLGYGFIRQGFSNTTFEILGIFALVTLVLSLVCNLIYIFSTLKKPAAELLKTAFIIKAVHIPTYILIFILGVLMGLMFFMTFPFVLLLVLIDLLTLWISGMISVYSISKALKEGELCSKAILIISMICQFFFCADVISMFVIRSVMKKKEKANK